VFTYYVCFFVILGANLIWRSDDVIELANENTETQSLNYFSSLFDLVHFHFKMCALKKALNPSVFAKGEASSIWNRSFYVLVHLR
jgi:hypothetical protein